MRYAILLCSLVASFADAGTSDSGKISQLYVDDSKNIAIKLEGGFPNSQASNECATNNGWAGVTVDAPELKSALLAAKASNASVTVGIYGCTNGDHWYRLRTFYINE